MYTYNIHIYNLNKYNLYIKYSESVAFEITATKTHFTICLLASIQYCSDATEVINDLN